MAALQMTGLALLALLAVALVIRIATPLPPLEPRTATTYLRATQDTPLGRGMAKLRQGDPGLSGVHPLVTGHDAFAARVLLARAATRSLDVQYYIWHKDLSGSLMLGALRDAADRGVRVRLLLDDNGIAGLDGELEQLDRHPNVEIRLFNPFVVRSPKAIGYATDFLRLNRRMHNKSFTADNQVAIIGGRNIGDEYFSARETGLFADLDVLAVGPAVEAVSEDFDRYWNSQSAYPAERLLAPPETSRAGALDALVARTEKDAAAQAYLQAIRRLPLIEQIVSGSLPFEWAPVRLISDDPAKALGRAKAKDLLAPALREALGKPREQVRLISGYFVPTSAGVEAFGAIARDGVDVAIFTNAFEATDVWVVHAGYADHRRALLDAGVRLFEMRGAPSGGDRRFLSTGSGSGKTGPVLRAAGATLHAKTFAVDGHRLFIGSFNFDPRSMHLNTELGFVIESPALAKSVSDAFDAAIPASAYEVVLADDGRLNWIERNGDEAIIHVEEPGTRPGQRLGIRLLSLLPIEWLL